GSRPTYRPVTRRDAPGGRKPRLRAGRIDSRRHQTPAQPRARTALAGAEGLTRVPILKNWLMKAAFEVQEYVFLLGATFRGILTPPRYPHDIVEQFDLIGVASLTVVLLTGFFTGAVLALQTGQTLDQFGARPVVGRLVSASMIKELGPVLTGLMLSGR